MGAFAGAGTGVFAGERTGMETFAGAGTGVMAFAGAGTGVGMEAFAWAGRLTLFLIFFTSPRVLSSVYIDKTSS